MELDFFDLDEDSFALDDSSIFTDDLDGDKYV